MVSSAPLLHDPLFQLLVSLPVFIVGVIHFGGSAFRSLRAGRANMDVLIIIGVFAAYVYSLVGFLFGLGPNYLFFETSAAIVCFVLTGNALESRAVAKTTSSLKDLVALQPQRAKRYSSTDHSTEEVDISAISQGETLLTGTGERVAFDGTVSEGQAAIDESLLTGESKPVQKILGDQVFAGTVVVGGNLKSTVQTLEQDSLLSQMIRLVTEAQAKKPSIQRLGDTVSSYFVPIVTILSLGTFVLSPLLFDISIAESLLRAIAVLVVACPCAMGLATPTAIMVGVGKAAKNGIVIKGGDSLERLATVDTVVFDKTGTITEVGTPQIEPCNGRSLKEVQDILYSLEQYSTHPLATTLTAHLKNQAEASPLTEVSEVRGEGISGKNSKGVLYSIKSATDTEKDIELFEGETLLAQVTFGETLIESVPELISELKKRGKTVELLSGDKTERVRAIAERAGVTIYHGEQKPADKLARIHELQESGRSVVFVGDGINDAAVLAGAKVGIALRTATDIAIQSADIVILSGKIEHLTKALGVSALTMRTIRQNLFWAFCYNILALPVAAAGYLSPIIAALAMAFSDVIVIGNSLRIQLSRTDIS